jgi:hypothetical protein
MSRRWDGTRLPATVRPCMAVKAVTTAHYCATANHVQETGLLGEVLSGVGLCSRWQGLTDRTPVSDDMV